MKKSRIVLMLLSPSAAGLIICIVLAALILAIANWSYTTQDPLLYDQVYGTNGIATNLTSATDGLSALTGAVTGHISYQVFVFIVAVCVGIGVYFVLQMLSRMLANASEAYSSIHASNVAVRRHNQEEIGLRLIIRAMSIVTWFFYWLFTIKVILPYVLITSKVRLQDFFVDNGWMYSLLALITLAVALHLHVVFMRFVTLRPRLFGGTDELLAARLSK